MFCFNRNMLHVIGACKGTTLRVTFGKNEKMHFVFDSKVKPYKTAYS